MHFATRSLGPIVPIFAASMLNAQDLTPPRALETGSIPSGASVVVLDSSVMRMSGARTLAELLAGRVPGLSVTFPSGITGTAARIHIRGSTGMTGSPEPLLYVDDILVREDRYWLGSPVPGQIPSFAWDLPVDEIERVRVILGPAGGATLEYGAARGAVFVTTKRPKGGRHRLEASADAITMYQATRFPSNYGTLSSTDPDDAGACTLSRQALGECDAIAVTSWNPLENASPFQTGLGARAHIRASGEVGAAAYRLGGGLQRGRGALDGGGLDRVDLSGALSGELRRAMTFTAEARYARTSGLQFVWRDYLWAGLMGTAEDDPVTRGYTHPLNLAALDVDHRADLLNLGIGGVWSVTERLQTTLRISADRGHRRSEKVTPPYEIDGRTHSMIERWSAGDGSITATGGVTQSHAISGSVRGTARVGVTVSRSWPDERTYSRSSVMLPDGNSLSGWQTEWVGWTRRHASVFLHERFQIGSNRSIGAGVRYERPQVLAIALRSGVLPAADFDWVVSSEPFFPTTELFSGLRLRAAYGESSDFGSVPTIAFIHDLERRAEHTAETEIGVSMTVLRDLAEVDIATYRRRTSDAVTLRAVGTMTGFLYAPLGGSRWTNSGTDMRLALRPGSIGHFRWQTTLTVSFVRQGGLNSQTVPHFLPTQPPRIGWYVASGEPIGAVWERRLTYADVNGDGVIDASEITREESPSPLGNTQPKRVLGFTASVTVRERLTVGTQIDGQTGHVKFNRTELLRCIRGTCHALHNPTASLDDQARAVAARHHITYSGFVENASFVKLRELWMRYTLPRFAQPPGATQATFVVSARNLGTWSRYSGLDPEAGTFLGPGLNAGELMSQPLLTSVSARLEVAW